MKKPPLYLKISVVVFSLGLATWFIAYRSGWLDSDKSVVEATNAPGPVPNPVVDTPETIMPSSKSAEMLSPEDETPKDVQTSKEVQAPKPERVRFRVPETNGSAVDEDAANRANLPEEDFEIMGSSKSGKMFFPDDREKLPDTPDHKTRTIMGSSKSDDIFTPDSGNDAPNKNGPANPGKGSTMMGSSKSGPIFTRPKPDTVKKAPLENQAPNQNNSGNQQR